MPIHCTNTIQSNANTKQRRGRSKQRWRYSETWSITMDWQGTWQQFQGLCTTVHCANTVVTFKSMAAMNGKVQMLTKLSYVQHNFSFLTSKFLKKYPELQKQKKELVVYIKCKDKHILDLIQKEVDWLYSLKHHKTNVKSISTWNQRTILSLHTRDLSSDIFLTIYSVFLY